MPDVTSQYQSPPFNGPFSQNSMLLDGVAAAPYEGLWIPMLFLKQATVEISGNFASASIQLLGSNVEGQINQQVVTVGGTVRTNDIMTVAFTNTNIPTTAVSYKAVAGDTTSTIASALAAAINANTTLKKAQISASVTGAVITISYPTVASSSGTAPIQPSQPGNQNITVIVPSVSNGGTETLTLSVGTNGTPLGTASAVGFIGLVTPMRYVKARVTAMTANSGINPTVTAALLGVG